MAEERPKLPWLPLLIYLGLGGLIFYVTMLGMHVSPAKRVSYSEFLAAIHDDKVQAVHVSNSDFTADMKATDKATTPESIMTARLPSVDE